MKRKLIFAVLVACVGVMTSCMRDEDWDLFNHPIHVSGTVDPYLGVPVAYGELNMNDIISSLSSEYSGYFNPDSVLMTIEYDTLVSDTIHAINLIPLPPLPPTPPVPAGKGMKSADTNYWSKDTVIVDTLDYDFFSNVNSLDGINVAHVWVDLNVGVWGDCPSSVAEHMNARFDSLKIFYIDHNDSLKQFTNSNLDNLAVDITDIRTGFRESFERVDVQSILNDRPKKIIAKYHFRLNIEKDFINESITNMMLGQIVGLDSLQMTKLVYSAEMKLQMPMQIRVDNMNYTFNVDLGDGLSSVNLDSIIKLIDQGIDIEVLDTKLRLKVENNIPIDMVLSAALIDEEGYTLSVVFFNEAIPAANISPVPEEPTIYYSSSPTVKELVKKFTASEIKKIPQAKKMRVNLLVGSNNKHVQIRRNDMLKLKAYLQVHPVADFDIEVSNNGLLK